MKGAALEEMIEFHFLQAAWRTEALLVTGRYVTRGWLALGFRFGAFKNDDIAWHELELGGRLITSIVVLVKRNRL